MNNLQGLNKWLPLIYSQSLMLDTWSFSDTADYKTIVQLDDLDAAEQNFCKKREEFGYSTEFSDVFRC